MTFCLTSSTVSARIQIPTNKGPRVKRSLPRRPGPFAYAPHRFSVILVLGPTCFAHHAPAPAAQHSAAHLLTPITLRRPRHGPRNIAPMSPAIHLKLTRAASPGSQDGREPWGVSSQPRIPSCKQSPQRATRRPARLGCTASSNPRCPSGFLFRCLVLAAKQSCDEPHLQKYPA